MLLTGNFSRGSSPTNKRYSSNTRPSASCATTSTPKSGHKKRTKSSRHLSRTFTLMQQQRTEIQVERTGQGTLHRFRTQVLPHAQTVQGKMAQPPRSQQVQTVVGTQGRLHPHHACQEQGQEVGRNIQDAQKQEE